MSQDPIYNDPDPIKVAGQDVVCREIPYVIARRTLRSIFQFVPKLKEMHPGADWSSGEAISQMIMQSIPEILDQAMDTVDEIIAHSTKLQPEQLKELPASDYIRLVTKVFEAQRPVIDAFLALKAKIDQVVPGTKTNGSPKPDSSPSWPEGASVSAKSLE